MKMKRTKLKNKLKTIVAGTLVFSLGAFGLTGCGSAKAGESTVGDTKVSVDTSEGSEEKADVNSEETTEAAAEATAGDAETAFDPDSVGEFTIRVGVNAGDQNQYLKILDNHTNFLKDRGINLETTEFAAGINTIDAITTGQLDVGLFADYAGVNRIGNTVDVTDLKAFAEITESNAYDLYVNPEVVKEPKDIEGQSVISMAGVVFEYDWGKFFETYDIDKSTVTLANVGSGQEGLALVDKNDVVASWVTRGREDDYVERGWKPLVNLEDIDAKMYTFLVSTEEYLSTHKEEVAKYLEVSDEAFAYISENLDEFAGWVEEDIGLSADYVKASWPADTHEYNFHKDAYEDLNKVEKWCYENGNFATDYDFADFINTDALELAFPDRVDWDK
jgi:NitT/TauT family transport system substrate-binding protein